MTGRLLIGRVLEMLERSIHKLVISGGKAGRRCRPRQGPSTYSTSPGHPHQLPPLHILRARDLWLLVAVFKIVNIFKVIMFVFVMHSFNVGGRCEFDGMQIWIARWLWRR